MLYGRAAMQNEFFRSLFSPCYASLQQPGRIVISISGGPATCLKDGMKASSGGAAQARFSRPVLRRTRRTFFGEIDRHCATRVIFRPSRSHTLGITISANSSESC